ncbi:hypothetical protein D9613_008867 [Agrocybe pediades]|uniref:Uncharacterized protein n=1 Tax=Agrocybe pediades TaxID=84607 RepID=A0A8H4QT56_9AGAR|nr:hypothetical protein D9613_008867 [Agrocybe pediades]
MTSTTTFDDRSPFIHYSPGWRERGEQGLDFDGTTMGTNTPGANATLVFNGTTISVFGTVQSDDEDQSEHIAAPTSSYSIDGGGQTVFTPPNIFLNTTQRNVTFFQATGLAPNASHTLVITLQNKGALFLDWIQVDGTYELPAEISSTNSTTSSPHSTQDPQQSASTNPLDGASGHTAALITPGDIGSIASGSLVLLLCIMAVLIYLQCAQIWWKSWKATFRIIPE